MMAPSAHRTKARLETAEDQRWKYRAVRRKPYEDNVAHNRYELAECR
jgi:hypothetical protein